MNSKQWNVSYIFIVYAETTREDSGKHSQLKSHNHSLPSNRILRGKQVTTLNMDKQQNKATIVMTTLWLRLQSESLIQPISVPCANSRRAPVFPLFLFLSRSSPVLKELGRNAKKHPVFILRSQSASQCLQRTRGALRVHTDVRVNN